MSISSQPLIHSLARKLKYYIDIQRKEDGFDLSGIDRSHQLYPNLKPLPILCVGRLHDRSLKHYFNDPNIKTMLQMTFGKTVEEQEKKLQLNYNREMAVERIIKKKMSTFSFSNFDSGDTFNLEKLKTGKGNQIHHCPSVLRQVPPPHVSRSEVLRLISSASKVIVATEITPQSANKKHRSKAGMKLQAEKPSEIEPEWTEYEVTIHTGSCLWSDSKANFLISFYGEEANVEDILLCNSLTNCIPFQKGQIDVFQVKIPNIGKLQHIIIGHDGEEPGCGWYLKDITIKNCSNSVTCVFHCNTWLSSQAYDTLTFQNFMPCLEQGLHDRENDLDDRESFGVKGQNETSKQNTEKSRVVRKATSRSTKRQPKKVLNKTKMSPCSNESAKRQNNSHSTLSSPRQSFSSQNTSRTRRSTLSTDSISAAFNKSMPKSFSKGQVECQNSLAESPEIWPTSTAQLKNQNFSKQMISIDSENNINKECPFQNSTAINSDERKVTIEEFLNVDSQDSQKFQHELPVTCMEDIENSNLSVKEWREGCPNDIPGVPGIVDGCLKTTESKLQISGTQSPHENIATAEDVNNLANIKQKSISFNRDIVRNTEFPQKGNMTTVGTINPGPSTTRDLEILQNVQNLKVTLDGCVRDCTEPEEYSEGDQVKEARICEGSKTEHPLKKEIAATNLPDSDREGGACDHTRNKLTNSMMTVRVNGHETPCLFDSGRTESLIHPDTDKNTLCSTEENETNINCINTDGVNLGDIFKTAVRTIENGEYYKLENLCQHHSGLFGYKDDDGRTVLHIAAICGNAEICKILFQNPRVQKQIDNQDKDGRTALHHGILQNNKRIKRLLLNNGAQSDIPDNNLETALDLALKIINEEKMINY
ncbi:uncharacterized protein LOC119978605 isoform X2 [Scyliorhinus canicula]|uniref:uncharacterized protein LOC119978605 isoform X2 n=1 Tax=Scyliorhinus canicula TaxID=7830 RepID=UPI0018F5F4E6|nr:uncharacterized protein LOC119978605 isoform X2 [Scyliorhinus canicula]